MRHPVFTYIRRSSYLVLAGVGAGGSFAAAQSAIDPVAAREVLSAAAALNRADLTALWGLPLDCPLILADPGSRAAVASVPDSAGVLHATEGLYTGILPDAIGVANTAVNWGGRRWTMLTWPLPARRRDRDRLLAHELFHCLQPRLGLAAASPLNAHLDAEEGRLWLRMEWRALEEALVQEGEDRRSAVEDALMFRARRRALFPEAAAEEHALEANEGLAEYTGLRGSGYPRRVLADRAAVDLASWERRTSFSRAFAYASGPAYGILLDESGLAWRELARGGADLGDLATRAFRLPPPAPTATELDRRGARYDLDTVRRDEAARAARAVAVAADLTRRFVDGPVLTLPPGAEFSYSFDPNAVQSFRGGTVHPRVRITDEWGVLNVSANGVWLARSEGGISAVVLPAPVGASAPVQGDGWELVLAPGWTVVAGNRPGDWTVVRR